MEAVFRDETVGLGRSVKGRKPLLSVGNQGRLLSDQNPVLSSTVFGSARPSAASGTIRLQNAFPMRPASRHPPHDTHFRCQVRLQQKCNYPDTQFLEHSLRLDSHPQLCPAAAQPRTLGSLTCLAPLGTSRWRPPSPPLSLPVAAFYKRGLMVRCNDSRYWSESPTCIKETPTSAGEARWDL